MFLDNKYTIWYNNIIFNSKSRSLGSELYVEKHHIIPKSLGGDDSSTNIAVLTAREHFICHLLLIKMVNGLSKHKMAHALWMMTRKSSKMNRNYQINSKIYEIARVCHQEAASARHKGTKKPRTEQHQSNLSKALRGRKFKFKSPSNKIGKTYEEIYGVEQAKLLREKRSETLKGRLVSDETRTKQSQKRKGKTNGGKNNNAKPFILDGVQYSCKKEAQKNLNISLYLLNKRLK